MLYGFKSTTIFLKFSLQSYVSFFLFHCFELSEYFIISFSLLVCILFKVIYPVFCSFSGYPRKYSCIIISVSNVNQYFTPTHVRTHTHAHICLSMFVKAQGNISKDISQLSTGWQGAGVWYWGGEVGGFILLFTVVHVHTKLWPNISLHYCTLHIYIVLYCTLTLYNSFLHLLQCILNTVPCP